MTGEIIIADTISAKLVDVDIYQITALVMGASDDRGNAKSITVLWNQATGTTNAKNLLITVYNNIINPPESAIVTQLKTDIGTVIPIQDQTIIQNIQLVRVVT